MMDYSEKARKALTEASEGCKLIAYPDPGTGGEPWTIGYGHTHLVRKGDICTQEDADRWLQEDIKWAVREVNTQVGIPLTQGQFDALVDFVFNVGPKNFRTSTLLKLVNQGRFAAASAEFGKWVNGGGHALPGLVKRRAAEAAWFNNETEN